MTKIELCIESELLPVVYAFLACIGVMTFPFAFTQEVSEITGGLNTGRPEVDPARVVDEFCSQESHKSRIDLFLLKALSFRVFLLDLSEKNP